MKEPKFGSNALQSFIEFETTQGKLRFGKEGLRLFLELGTTKRYLTNDAGAIDPDAILENTSGGGITLDGVKFENGQVTISTPLVTTAFSTVTIKEYGDGRNMTTELTLVNFVVGHIPAAAANLVVGAVVGVFPAGSHIEEAWYQRFSLTLPGTPVNADVGIGSVAGVGVHALLSDADSGAEDRIPGQTTPTAAGGGTTTAGVVKSALTGISVNIPTDSKNIYLNAAGTWNVDNHGDLLANGIIVVRWTVMS